MLTYYTDGAELSKNVTFDEVSTSAGKLLNSSATLKLWPTSNDDGNSYQCGMKIDGRFLGTNGVEDLNPAATVEINVQSKWKDPRRLIGFHLHVVGAISPL